MICEWAQKMAHVLLRLWMTAYNRLRAPRLRLGRPSLIVANHASHMDIAAIFASIPLSEIPRVRTAAAKDHIFALPAPLLAIVKFLFNVFPFERKERSTRSLERCANYLRRGYHVVIFPEGRRSPDGGFLGFTPGFASGAVRTGAPVVPVRLDGTHRALPRGAMVPVAYPLTVSPREAIAARAVAPGERRREYGRLVDEANASIGRPAAREASDC